ncbi:Androgen-dependent TFPI-regulating protein [Halotydeus destructor]|nr:Androgen-dependent TFPI-regulating protein [Halotydeus destructor]
MTVKTTLVAANRVVNVAAYTFALVRLSQSYPKLESLTGDRIPCGIFKFFTVWTVLISVAFYFACLTCEVFAYLKFNTEKFSFRGLVYHSLVVPFGLFSATIFWWLYWSDRHLVRPKEVDELMPTYITHILHTLPVIGLLVEACLFYHPLPPRRVGLRLFYLATVAYFCLVSYVGFKSNNWVYPFLQSPPIPIKFIVMFGLIFAGSAVYFVGEKVHLFIWRNKIKADKQD